MVTILSLISTLARGGPVHVLKGIIRNLDRERYQPVVATLSGEPADSCINELRGLGVEIQQLNMSRPASWLIGKKKVRDVVHSSGADIIHCHGIRSVVLVAGASLKHPALATLHADIDQYYKLAFGRPLAGVMARREYAALKRFRCVVAVSENVSEAARSHGVETTIAPNGIDLGLYRPPLDLAEVRDIRQRLGWPSDSIIVLHTGVLVQGKHPVDVVNGFSRVSYSKRSMLVFAGDGPLRGKCMEAAINSSNVVFLGRRHDVADLLRAADIVISNSESEGLPMALLEACACGLRVIASDIEPHRYIAKLFPEQVTLFPVGDSEALTEQLNTLVRRRPGNPIRPPAASLEMISAKRMSHLYQDVYDAVLSDRCAIARN